jgi:hypothetical protein
MPMQPVRFTGLALMAILLATAPAAAELGYAWRDGRAARPAETLASRIAPPPGFVRAAVEPASFAAWLRGLPLKPAGAPASGLSEWNAQ